MASLASFGFPRGGETPEARSPQRDLFEAAVLAQTKEVKRIVRAKCDVNCIDQDGYTALMHVAVYADTEQALPALKQLLLLKADPNQRSDGDRDKDNDTAFEKACARSRADAVCAMLKN
jgi:ankyrin repeat protein